MGVNKNFVVKNGLEVDTDLILANADSNRVGIGTSMPTRLLHVNGAIGATHLSVSGIASIKTLSLENSTISIGNTYGRANQIISADGFGGVSWRDLPELRVSESYVAAANQTDFAFQEVVGFIDVYINGVKLSTDNFVYTPGVQITLANPTFDNDIVEIIGYAAQSSGTGGGGLFGITVFQNGITKGSAGLVTSINFVDQIIGVNSTGFAVTVYGGGGGSIWRETPTGLSTVTSVGIGTTNATSKLTVIGDGSFTQGLRVSGVTTVGISSTNPALYVDGGATVTGVVTAAYFEGDGSRITGIIASGFDTGWDISNVGIGTTARVGIGTTNPTTQLQIGRAGYNLSNDNLLVYGGANVTGDVSVGSSLRSSFATLGSLTFELSTIDVDASSSGLISIGGTAVRILGDLYIDGTQSITSSVYLHVSDKIIGIGSTVPATDIGADAGGIILYGDTNKEFLWDYTDNAWTSNVNIGLSSNRSLLIDGTPIVSKNSINIPSINVSGTASISTVSAGFATVTSIYSPQYLGNGNSLSGIVTSIVAGQNISITNSVGRVVISATGVGTGGGGGVSVSIGDSAPPNPTSGKLWYDSLIGRGFIYYVDDDGAQWVDFSPNGGTPSNSITLQSGGVQFPQAISTINFEGNVSISTSLTGIATVGINTALTVSSALVVNGITTTSTLRVGTGGTIIATTANGFVGIGSTIPTSNLDVNGNVNVSGILTSQSLSVTNSIVGITTTSELHVGTAGTVIATTLGGLVGIGTTVASERLTVDGNGSFSGFVTATTYYGDGSNLTGDVSAAKLRAVSISSTGTTLYPVFVGIATTASQDIVIDTSSLSYNAVTSTLGITSVASTNIRSTSASYLQSIYLDSDGIFRIGNQSNGAYLDQNGSVLEFNLDTEFTSFTFGSNGLSDLSYYGNESKFVFGPSGQCHVTLNNNTNLNVTGITTLSTFNVGTAGTVITTTVGGSVGVGTTSPTDKLTVRGGDISVGVSTAHGVILTSPNGTRFRLIVDDSGSLSTVAV